MIRSIRESSVTVQISRDDFDRMCRENGILQGLSRSDYIEIRDLFNIGYEDFDAAVNDLWNGDDGYHDREWYEDLLKKYTNSVNESLKESSNDSTKKYLIKRAQKVSNDLTGDAWISDQFVKSKGTRILLNIPIAKDIDSAHSTEAEARAMKVYDTNDVWWDDFVLQVDVTNWFEGNKNESLKESVSDKYPIDKLFDSYTIDYDEYRDRFSSFFFSLITKINKYLQKNHSTMTIETDDWNIYNDCEGITVYLSENPEGPEKFFEVADLINSYLKTNLPNMFKTVRNKYMDKSVDIPFSASPIQAMISLNNYLDQRNIGESLKESIVFSKEETPQGKVEVSRHKDGTYRVLVNGEEHAWFDQDDLTSLKNYLKYKKDISDEDLAKATLFKESTQLKFDDDMINDIEVLYMWRPEEVERILIKHGSDKNSDNWIDGLDLPAAYDEIMSTFKDKYSDDDEIDYDVAKVLGLVEESLKEDTSRHDLLWSVSRMLSHEDWCDDNVEFHTKLHKDGSRWIYSDRPLGDNDARRVTGYIEDILIDRYDMNRQDFKVIEDKYSGWTILFKESKSIKESFPRTIDLDQVVIQVANLVDEKALGDDWIEVFPIRDAIQSASGEYFVRLEITGPDDVKKKATFRTRNGRVEVAFLNGSEAMCDSAESIARFIAGEFGLSIREQVTEDFDYELRDDLVKRWFDKDTADWFVQSDPAYAEWLAYSDAVTTEDFKDAEKYAKEHLAKNTIKEAWQQLRTKEVTDSDGFITEYSLWHNNDDDTYVCIFGDSEMYTPDDSYPDAEFDTEKEAYEWFNSYEGFGEDD